MSRGPRKSSALNVCGRSFALQVGESTASSPSSQAASEALAKADGNSGHELSGASSTCPDRGRGAGADDVVHHSYRALCLCEIANFLVLRRRLGRQAAEQLIHDVISLIVDLDLDVRVAAVGRATAELSFERDAQEPIQEVLELLRRRLMQMRNVDGAPHQLDIRFGLAIAPARGCDELRLVEAAEAALAEAQSQGPVVVRDLSQTDLAFDRLAMTRELPRALARGEMFIQYQPKVHVRRQKVASAEALLRWQHPSHGLIAPADFIGVAEEAGEIGALTLWTLRRVIEDQRRLASAGYDIPLFLNISGMLLADAAFVAEACEIVSATDAKLGFEITETAVIRDPESAIRHLQNFARIGVHLAIDDYGAGLSSLAYLKQLPARELKIDKMFVLQLTSSNRDPLIVRSTIDLAHALEMEVTAEGVETPSALALLSVMGCDMVQGFLISRPVAIDALLKFLQEDAHLTSGEGGQSPFARPESFWKRA